MSKHYAMIVNDRVIDVLLNQEKEPHWPPTPEGTPVITVECDEFVERGMVYNAETGEFSEYVPGPVVEEEYEPTFEERVEATLDYIAMTK